MVIIRLTLLKSKSFLLISLLVYPFLVSCSSANLFDTKEICRTIEISCIRGIKYIKIITNRGEIIFKLDGDSAPITVSNFIDLVERGVYERTTFHRVIKDPNPFILQGGDPNSNKDKIKKSLLGLGNFVDPKTNKARFIPLEIKLKNEEYPRYGSSIKDPENISKIQLRHKKGSISMARSEKLNSASSQFFIALNTIQVLDGRYAVFGNLIKGMDVLDLIKEGDIINKINVVSK